MEDLNIYCIFFLVFKKIFKRCIPEYLIHSIWGSKFQYIFIVFSWVTALSIAFYLFFLNMYNFFFFLAVPSGMQDLSSSTKAGICDPLQ